MAFKWARGQSPKGSGAKEGIEFSQPLSADKSVPEGETAAIIPEIVEELTEQESAERRQLELKVESSFVEAGLALEELRARKLYRSTHHNFQEYCQDRFSFTRRSVDYLIAAANVVENLKMRTNGSQILPTNERQVRPLTKFEPEQQCQVWDEAVEAAGGRVPSGRIVKSIVDRLKEKPLPQIPLSFKRNDAFILQGLSGAERRYNNCWAIAHEILEFSLIVETHDGSLQIKPDNLEPIDDRAVRRQIAALLKRIQQLRKFELDRGASAVLEVLGKQTFLTEVEERLLKVLEDYYGIT